MDRYAYYVCFKCGKAYFGGEARCDLEAGGGDAFNPEELVCGGCSDVSQVSCMMVIFDVYEEHSQAQMCPKHGTDYLEYKCRYCCSVAVFFCFGTTHFCTPCHDDFQRVANIPKAELPQCPVAPKVKTWLKETPMLNVFSGCAPGGGRVSSAREAPSDWRGVCPRLWRLQERSHLLVTYVFIFCDQNLYLSSVPLKRSENPVYNNCCIYIYKIYDSRAFLNRFKCAM